MSYFQRLFPSVILTTIGIWVAWVSFTQEPAAAFLFPRIVATLFVILAGWGLIAALLNEMQGGWTDVSFNGVALISTVLDFRFDDTSEGNDVGFVGLMPGFAATAWYHERVDRSAWDGDLEAFIANARDFA